jgi:tetratricopeptide (TPR) repeat protein
MADTPAPKRLWIFKLISIVLVPLILLGLLELSLRLFHYGDDLRVFIPYPHDSKYMVLNPKASLRYFPDAKIATVGNVELFKKHKDTNTLRFFVLGESTTIGYPYFHNGSFHRWLAYRLMHAYPDKQFEIINLSLTAVNSYTVRGFAQALIDYQPDGVLIYCGHNEYYGALGVGSTQHLGGNLTLVNWIIKLRSLRIMQLLTNAYRALHHPRQGTTSETRMQFMVAQQQIPYGSALFERGVRQFTTNMQATLRMLTRHHIPVFLSNLVSNTRDLPPFISAIDTVRYPGFMSRYRQGIAAWQAHQFSIADSLFLQAEKICPGHAGCNYYLGRLALQRREIPEASGYLARAKDLDALRFRAPDTFNTIIDRLCKSYDQVYEVDTRQAFVSHARQGIIGDSLILDHVHPDLRGYGLMSDAFYHAMEKAKVLPARPENTWTLKQLFAQMPLTRIDSLVGAFKMHKLKRSWPFYDTAGTDRPPTADWHQQLAYQVAFSQVPWEEAMRTLYTRSLQAGDLPTAGRVTEALMLEHPTEAGYYNQAANLYGRLQQEARALFYFRKAFALAPDFEKARYIFVLYLQQDEPLLAKPYLEYALAHHPSAVDLGPIRQYTEEVIQLKDALQADSANVALLGHIAQAYVRMNNRVAAARYVKKILHLDPDNTDALAIQARLNRQK